MQAIATLGPYEHPKRVEVTIERPSTMPGFYICRGPADAQLTIHRHNLRAVPATPPEPVNAS